MTGKLLVADGEEKYRELVEGELTLSGYEVVVAATDEEAVSKVCEYFPDLAILDIRLPESGGIETMEHIRALACKIPLILTSRSCFCDEGFRIWSADACVVKSTDLGELKAVVRRLLARKSKERKVEEKTLPAGRV